MRNKKLVDELNNLFWGEISCCIVFPIIYLWLMHLKFNFTTFGIVSVLSIILFQGAFYWKYRLKKMQGNEVMNRFKIGRLYNQYKTFDSFMLLFLAIRIIFFSNAFNFWETLFQIFLYLFLVLEYINYFYIRLSFYTKNKMFLQIIKPIKIIFTRTGKSSKIADDIKYFKQNKEH